MFPNLEAEMARSKITQLQMAEMLGVTPTTLSFKLNGKSSLSLKECVLIKQLMFKESYSKRNPCKFRNRISWISMPGLGGGTSRKQNDCL